MTHKDQGKDKIEDNISTPPSFPEFCFGHPLYEKISFEDEAEITLSDKYFNWAGKYDSFCPYCGRDTVFSLERSMYLQYVNGKCTRVSDHVVSFFLKTKDKTIQKIGQFPSLADTQIGELNKFRAVMDKEISGEFYKAIGLSAHDVGIGAFVYLRRVLERLIAKREITAIRAGKISASALTGKRVNERIKLLRGFLPDILVDNAKIYSVLSKGVHELEEKECLAVFPALRDLMFFILEEDLENEAKRQRLESAQKRLSSL